MRETTVAELCAALATADGGDEAVIYVDLEGEWVAVPPYPEGRTAVCGYFEVAQVCVTTGGVAIITGAETAL